MNSLNLYKFEAYFGRLGSLYGLFLATEEEINNIAGESIWFGEALGKHSEIYNELNEKID